MNELPSAVSASSKMRQSRSYCPEQQTSTSPITPELSGRRHGRRVTRCINGQKRGVDGSILTLSAAEKDERGKVVEAGREKWMAEGREKKEIKEKGDGGRG